jgi:hypothetical protein
VEAAQATQLVDGVLYAPHGMQRVDAPSPKPSPLTVHTLEALAGYLLTNKDNLPLSQLLIHVSSPAIVEVHSNLHGAHRQRFTYLDAEAILPKPAYPFGQYSELEKAIIQIQTRFVDDEHRASLLRFLGNVRTENIKTSKDDGVTQEVTARAGVVGLESVPVPNPVTLRPYRTFPEVEQPSSPFLLRLKMNGSDVMVYLEETDGGRWQLEAIRNVLRWLRQELPDPSSDQPLALLG